MAVGCSVGSLELEDLITDIDWLSLKGSLSQSRKKEKKQDDLILGVVWSDEDESIDEETCDYGSDNELLQPQTRENYECSEEKIKSYIEEKENFSPNINTINTSNVTTRKRSKKKNHSVNANLTFEHPVARILSYSYEPEVNYEALNSTNYCMNGANQENNFYSENINHTKLKEKANISGSPIVNSPKFEHSASSLINSPENSEISLTVTTEYSESIHSNTVLTERTSQLEDIILNTETKNTRPQTINMVDDANEDSTNISRVNSLTLTPDIEEVFEPEEGSNLENSDTRHCSLTTHVTEYCDINEEHSDGEDLVSKILPSTKCTPSVTVLSSGTDSDSLWESDDSSAASKITECDNYPLILSTQESHSLVQTVSTDILDNKPITLHGTKRQDSIPQNKTLDSSDDDLEAFLAEMKTPKVTKSNDTNSTRSLESFIVDDWIVSSDEDDLPPLINRITSNLKASTRKTVSPATPSLDEIVEHCLISSDEEEHPALLKIKLLNNHDEKIRATIKNLNTPRCKKTPLKKAISGKSPPPSSIKKILTPYLNTPRKFWHKSREQLSSELFRCYNETIFGNKLPQDMPIIWNKQMTKTAGFCYYIGSSIGKKCRIELSEKVVDSCERIRDTLIHELCHAATWLIDGVKAGHGPHWKRWAHQVRFVHSDLPPISRCHSYDINYKFNYQCVKCHHRFGRHSKSIKLDTARCPYCLSRLELLPTLNKDGTPMKPRAPTKFSLFVKDNYRKIKEERLGSNHQEIMKELSRRFAQTSVKNTV